MDKALLLGQEKGILALLVCSPVYYRVAVHQNLHMLLRLHSYTGVYSVLIYTAFLIALQHLLTAVTVGKKSNVRIVLKEDDVFQHG